MTQDQPLYTAAQTQAAIAAEREACAAECEREMMYPGGRQIAFAHQGVQAAARAIRARGGQAQENTK